MKSSVKNSEIKVGKEKKTASLQCNLLKNVPKIRLFPKKTPEIIERKPAIQPNPSKELSKLKNQTTQSAKTLSSS